MTHPIVPISYTVLDNGEDVVLTFQYLPFIQEVVARPDGGGIELRTPGVTALLAELPDRVRAVLPARGALVVGLTARGEAAYERRIPPGNRMK